MIPNLKRLPQQLNLSTELGRTREISEDRNHYSEGNSAYGDIADWELV
jgi:hypothetical protein